MALATTIRVTAPKVFTSQHAIKKILTETLDGKQTYGKYYYTVSNPTTNALLRVISGERNGGSDTIEINELLESIGIDALNWEGIEKQELSKPFYQALHAVYYPFHPELAISKGPKYSERKDERAKYDFWTHSVSFFRQAFQDLHTKGLRGEKLQQEMQRMLVYRLLAELAHAAQHKDGDLYRRTVRDKVVYNMVEGIPRESLYTKEGAMEYNAHHVIEVALQKQFTEEFAKNMDTSSPQDWKMLGDLLSGYRYREEKNMKTQSSRYQDDEEAVEAYRMAACLGCPNAQTRLSEICDKSGIVPTGIYLLNSNTSPSQSALSQHPAQ